MITNGTGRPVIALDADGTLFDYHGWFLRFATDYWGRRFPSPEAINSRKPLHTFMGLTLAEYRETKLAYRQGGLKRSMPCLEGAADLVKHVRKYAEVWICTTRPYLRLDNIDPDTREALRRNNIKYDGLLFDPVGGDNKYKELKRQAGARVCAVVEDLPEQVLRAVKLGLLPIYLRNQPYNQPMLATEQERRSNQEIDVYGVWRWDTAEELQLLLTGAIAGWLRTQKEARW